MTEPSPQESVRGVRQYGLWGLGVFLSSPSRPGSSIRWPLNRYQPSGRRSPGWAEIGRSRLGGQRNGGRCRSCQASHVRQIPQGDFYQWLSRVTDWVGFGLTSMITVVAGVLGRSLRPGEDPTAAVKEVVGADSTQSSRRWVTVVGVIAALASVMIGLSSKLQAESQRAMDQGEGKGADLDVTESLFQRSNLEAALEVANNLDAETRKESSRKIVGVPGTPDLILDAGLWPG